MAPIPSQVLDTKFKNLSFKITLDSGATVSYIRLNEVTRLTLDVFPNDQLALLADQKTRMASLGEVDFIVSLGNIVLRIRALVMKNLQADCFGGTTFHADNDIQARIKTGEVRIHDKFVVHQSNVMHDLPLHPPSTEIMPVSSIMPQSQLPKLESQILEANVPRTSQCDQILTTLSSSSNPAKLTNTSALKFNAISIPSASVTYSEEFLPILLPQSLCHLHHISIIPSFPTIPDDSLQWLPQVCEIVQGCALYQNQSRDPVIAPKFAHFKPQPVLEYNLMDIVPEISRHGWSCPPLPTRLNAASSHSDLIPVETQNLLSLIKINAVSMSPSQISRLDIINNTNHRVFDNNLIEGYNHSSGQFFADFTFSGKPPPTRVFVPQYNRKCSDLQQAKCDELESQGVLVDPKLFGIPVLHVSPSWIQQKGRAKHKSLQECTLSELRFITAFNALNDFIRAKPSSSCTTKTIFTFLSRWKHHIYGDLNNSYFQLPVQKKLWSYLGIMTPHKGIRVMTRTGQGLLGSDVELEQLLCRVLGQAITDGYCVAIRDDIIIGGNTIDEALSNYEKVLQQFDKNNLKLSPNKVRIFPIDTEVYGYRVKNGCIEPSEHIKDSLGKTNIESLVTVKSVNSWKGLYKRLIGHLPGLASVMSPFDAATGGKSSREKFVWTPALTAAYNVAMSQLSQINKTFLPDPSEQLVLLPDTMSVPPCTGWVLYTTRDGKLLPVVYCSAKLKDYMTKWFPCEQEACGVVLAIDQCSHWIGESKQATLVGPDSSAVVKASQLIKRGKHSSNPRLQSLLASVNRRNITFFHNSAKAGKHVIPDHLSRMKDSTCRSKDCAIERFLDDIPIKIEAMATSTTEADSSTLLSIFLEDNLPTAVIIAATSAELSEQLLLRSGPIPLGSRYTWINIQKSDEECRAVFKMKSLGNAPRKKNTNPTVNKIFKEAIVHQGLLVVRAVDGKTMREVDRVVVPPSFLDSILTVTHIKLNHPTQYQLKQVFDRYFFSPKLDSALDKLYSSCHLCISFRKFPKELEQFSPTLFPSHPGSHMNIDIIKRAGELILVNIDLFSGYVTTCLSNSEKASDLSAAIIQAVTPIRHSNSILVRVDKAPALVSMSKDTQSELMEVGIKLEVADDENKNANCCVDKAICELENELKKLSPSGDKLTSAQLAQATVLLNSKIRNRGLSAAEIHFSRDSHNSENLQLEDSQLKQQQIKLRDDNHSSSARSKAPRGKVPDQPDLQQGEVVYIKNHGTKHTAREPHIVLETKGKNKTLLRKALHSSPFDNKPIGISSQQKIVSNKFIFKPNIQAQTNQVDFPDAFPAMNDDSNSSIAAERPVLSWHPISRDDDDPIAVPYNCEAGVYDNLQSDTELDLILFSDDEDHGSDHEDVSNTDLGGDAESDAEEAEVDDAAPSLQPLLVQQNESTNDVINAPPSNIDSHEEDTVSIESDQPPADDHHNTSDSDTDRVVIFNDGYGLNREERLVQDRIPRKNDRVSFYSTEFSSWRQATLSSNPKRKKGWKFFYHYIDDDGYTGGVYLVPNERWTFLVHNDNNSANTANQVGNNIGQVDGAEVPASLTPTPETSPDQELAKPTGTRPKLSVRFGPADYDGSSESDLDDSPYSFLRRCSYAKDLDSSDQIQDPYENLPLDTAVNYGRHALTVTIGNIPLDRAVNLDNVLPISSTPKPDDQPEKRSRISNLRRLLPLESPRETRPAFLNMLNPFKKKSSNL